MVVTNYSKDVVITKPKVNLDLYNEHVFGHHISELKWGVDLYTRSTYTRVYTVMMIVSQKQ